ncbi:poly(ADP-ribose) polymerase family member 14-related sequence 1 isoform X2 [Clarias gariepinus]|uniref:poly(ADP-ribose) polymerase family member 14-related sequence 1 isoform X2 n=1 Tax=Clarias gariepinus TaxID=13013 RepID=UPI00234DADCD|nr:poly(ADP-ribose) polymerase family member 14-related sequence 1 isoform X2 [Clarias gariepinus]
MDEEFPFALFVEGKWDPRTPKLKNKLIIYFQSKRSNGGDCLVQYEVSDGQKATVRFKTEEVRQNVLEKQDHKIKLGKESLSLSVYLSPSEAKSSQETKSPVDTGQTEKLPTKDEKPTSTESQIKEEEDTGLSEDSKDSAPTLAVIKNIQNVKLEFLEMLVENVLKETPESKGVSIELIPECSCAVITFMNRKDAVDFIMSGPENSICKRKNLEISLLDKTTKVKVEDLPPGMNSDYISLYFEKFGEIVGDVEMLEDDESAIITFNVHEDANAVLRHQHMIKKHPIKVFPYHESLGVALYGKERPTLKLPEFFIENIDESVWKYLQEHQKPLDQIMQDMQKHFCHLEFQDPAVRICPLPSILQQGAQTKKLIQTWKEKASAQFTTAVSQYTSLKIDKIERDAWLELEAEIQKMLSSEPVSLILHEGQGTMIIAGLAEDVRRTGEMAQSTVNRITQRIQRQKSSIEDEVSMTPSIYELVMKDGLEDALYNTFPELRLCFNAPSEKLTLFGVKQEVLESKNKILQEVIGLTRGIVELHSSVLEFLNMADREELTKKLFLSKGIRASLEINKDQVFLVAKTDRTFKDGENELKVGLYHACIDIDDPSVIRTAEWHNLVDRLSNTVNSSVMMMLINTSDRQVVISGFAESVQWVQEQLSDYVLNNSCITSTLQADKIIVNFIKEHKKEDCSKLLQDKIDVNFKGNTITLTGPRLYVSECQLAFEDLCASVYCCNFKVDKPGAKKCFKIKGEMMVERAKVKMGCVVELVDEQNYNQISSNLTEKKRVRTPDGVEIVVNKDDMCSYPVDAIVNAANVNLNLNGGLSKALSDAAGPKLQEACKQIIKRRTLKTGDVVHTEAGQLPCKHVIHAVGPNFDRSDPQEAIKCLKNAVKRSLNLADSLFCQSLAIPAISSGNLGFPPNLCADTIVSALEEFFKFVNGETCLKEIHLIDKNDNTIAALEAAVQKAYGGSSTSQDSTFRGNSSSHQQNLNTASSSNRHQQNLNTSSYSNQGSSQSVKTNEGLTVTLAKCNIQDTSLDVLVNSVAPDLALNHGAIAQAILATAGPQIQTLLNQQAKGPANDGAVFITSGCNLKNKVVFHAVAPHWKQAQGSAQSTLEGIMDECLRQAEQQKQGSIVFPAIGTGNLGFPKPLVATTMLDSVLKFSKTRTSSHVQEVMFALHPSDHLTIQAFTSEFNQKFNIQSSSASDSSEGPFSKVTSPKTGMYETTVGGVVLQVLSGDITKETTDAIVNSTNDNFTLKSGVSKAILDAAGPNVEAECQQQGAQPNKGLIMTQQGNLQCKKIIHISAMSNLTTIQKRVRQALEMLVKQKFTSIAFPAFGTGQGGANPGNVADAMMDAVIDFLTRTPQSSLKTVRIVIFQAPMLVDFHQSMLRKEVTVKQKTESAWSRLTTFTKSFFMPKSKDVTSPQEKDFLMENKSMPVLCFSICGPSKTAVDETMQFIDKFISEEQAFQSISDAMILSLSEKDKQRIRDLQRTMDVNVKIEQKAQAATAADSEEVTLIVEGLSRDVLVVIGEINNMLKTTRDDVNKKQSMELTAEFVDWQYQQGGQYHSFDLATNFKLEQACSLNSQQVDINFQGQIYNVKIPEGPAVSGGTQMEIRRVDKMSVAAADTLPQEWEVMASTELIKVCPLKTGSKEYNDVLADFRKTCPNNVLKIDRIQNPSMWKNYQNNKQYMEKKNGHQNNEKMLFHGTREDSINHINHSGFNRSYAGLNAAAYGKGTYFALNASYSSSNTYSVPNAQGHKRMYYCRVLTGDYAPGNGSMITPPAKTTNGTDLYDTVVDNTARPTIFVVFRDYHAYPEYLITFT